MGSEASELELDPELDLDPELNPDLDLDSIPFRTCIFKDP